MKNTFIISSALILVALAACREQSAQKHTDSPFKPDASIQEIMQSVIVPNIDPIWDSVQTVSTVGGVEERHPKTDEDWQRLKKHAIVVREATNLILMEGRKVASSNTSTVAAELGPEAIEQAIAANRPAFIKNAHELHAAVTKAITAIDAKNVAALEEAGEGIDQACEKCHLQFWYPGEKLPPP